MLGLHITLEDIYFYPIQETTVELVSHKSAVINIGLPKRVDPDSSYLSKRWQSSKGERAKSRAEI